MSRKHRLTRTELRRVEAINAAAIAFAGGDRYERIDELWSLTVFFERYLERGSRGTLKQFGPAPEPTAEILKLVPRA